MNLTGETPVGQAFATKSYYGEEIKCIPKCMKKIICYFLIMCILVSNSTPVFAKTNGSAGTNNNGNSATKITVKGDGIIVNERFFSKKEFERRLMKAVPTCTNKTDSLSVCSIPGAKAGSYNIPGIGLVKITTAGLVYLSGRAIASSSWVYKKIVTYFKEHTKNKRKSTYNKHTKPRPGRDSEKKENQKHMEEEEIKDGKI